MSYVQINVGNYFSFYNMFFFLTLIFYIVYKFLRFSSESLIRILTKSKIIISILVNGSIRRNSWLIIIRIIANNFLLDYFRVIELWLFQIINNHVTKIYHIHLYMSKYLSIYPSIFLNFDLVWLSNFRLFSMFFKNFNYSQ